MTRLKIETNVPAVTLPEEVIRHLDLEPGEAIDVDLWPGGRCVLHVSRRTDQIESLFGILADRPRRHQGPVSIEDMNETIVDGWSGAAR